MKLRKSTGSTRGGFTLVEMLIVLAILVGLAAMVVPRLLSRQKSADRDNAASQIGALKGCLNMYHLDMKKFPSTEEGLGALVSQPAGAVDEVVSLDGAEPSAAASAKWDGPYTETGELPTDPWGNLYSYEYPPTRGKGDFPDIWSLGPDGQDNTEDDICSWTQEAGGGGDEYGQLDDYGNLDDGI